MADPPTRGSEGTILRFGPHASEEIVHLEGHAARVKYEPAADVEGHVEGHAGKFRFEPPDVEGHAFRWSDERLKHAIASSDDAINALRRLAAATTEPSRGDDSAGVKV